MLIELAGLVGRINNLAPLPATATRLAQLLSSPECEMKDLLEAVELDPALTARLLRVANSAAYAARSPARSIRDGIVRIGSGALLTLAIGSAVRKTMSDAVPVYGLDEDALWRHSVAAALATETLAESLGVRVPPETFAAALLHDLGKLILGRHAAELLGRALPIGALEQVEAELEQLQTSHAEIGAMVAQRWNLPERIVLAIRHHHDPERGHEPICDLVCAANQLAHASKVVPMPRAFSPMERRSLSRLDLDDDAAGRILDILNERFEEVRARFE